MTPTKKENKMYYSAEYELPQRSTGTPTKGFWNWNRITKTTTSTTGYSAMISLIVMCSQIENSKRVKLDQSIQAIYEPENVRHANKKLLEDKVSTDTAIISGEGTKIECHKCFLIGI